MSMPAEDLGRLDGPTALLSRFAADLDYARMTDAARRAVRRHTLDSVGAIVAGSRQSPTRAAEAVLAEVVGAGTVPVPGLARRFDALSAAYIMGTAAHGLELDDGYRAGSVHPGCVVVPAVLAAGHIGGHDGRAIMAAIAVGYEVAIRIARNMHPASRHRGFHNSSVAGPLAAAAAVGSLRGFDAATIEAAMGFAASSSAGIFAFLHGGGEVKRTHPGHAAREGLLAALLAERGLGGPVGVLESEDGLFQAFSGSDRAAHVADGLGEEELAVTGCYLKPYAACRHLHPGVDAVLDVLENEAVTPDDVERVEIGSYAIAAGHLGPSWGNMLAAQMSYKFVVATALERRAVDLAHFAPEALKDPAVVRHCAKVAVHTDPDCDAAYPKERPAKVVMHLKDGRTFERFVREPYGAASNPMSDEAVSRKFRGLADPVLGSERAGRVEDMLWHLEDVESAPELAG